MNSEGAMMAAGFAAMAQVAAFSMRELSELEKLRRDPQMRSLHVQWTISEIKRQWKLSEQEFGAVMGMLLDATPRKTAQELGVKRHEIRRLNAAVFAKSGQSSYEGVRQAAQRISMQFPPLAAAR